MEEKVREELAPEPKKASVIEVLTRSRISLPKICTWVFIIIIILGFMVSMQPKYPKNAPDEGFKWGYKYPGGYAFPFYYDLEYGQQFIDDGDKVYSNIYLYILQKEDGTVNITVTLYKPINVTYYMVAYNICKQVNITGFKWEQIELNMPHDDTCMFKAMLFINGQLIVQFYYRFNVLTSEVNTTLGDLLISQIVYLIVGFIIMLIGMLIAKSISTKYPSPEPDLATGGYFLLFAGLFLYLVTKELVIVYGLVNASIMYIPFLIISTIAGFYIVGREPKRILLLNVNADSLMIQQDEIKYQKIEGQLYVVPNLAEFLLYKPTTLQLSNYNLVFKCSGEYDYVIYYTQIDRQGNTLKINVSNIHNLRVEEYKTNVQKVLALSQAVENQKKKIKNLEIDRIIRTGEEAIEIIKKLFQVDLEEV